ncbi:MAG: methionine--tRNA ligase subunit beta [Patescibacteria group bacterium]|nr:methionine--tRNA ligase subunit beta [Patescibacteria group bacterium]
MARTLPRLLPNMITFDDFTKLEIRIGKVLSAEKVEGADKLLKLQVDFGEYQRQIVSGIAEYYSPEQIAGKEFPFIVNLEPRVIRGVESQGMIMAADLEGQPVLISPDKEIPAGSKVK